MKKIVFLGTPTFAVKVLAALVSGDYQIVAVVTQPDKAVGRKKRLTASPVKNFAQKNDLPVLQPRKLSGSIEESQIIAAKPDLIITAAFGQFLSNELLASAKIAAINFHASLLPKYRGAAPIQGALRDGANFSGITIMEMVAKMDAGDIFFQEKIAIDPEDNLGSLTEKLSNLAQEMAVKDLPLLIKGEFKRQIQDPKLVTFAPSIKPEDEQLNFQQDSNQIINQIRSLSPNPGAYFLHQGERIKIFKAKIMNTKIDGIPGSIYLKNKKQLGIIAGDHKGILISQLQIQGGKPLLIQDFLNGVGRSLKIGDQFVTTTTA